MITRPVRERSITGIGEMVETGLKASGYEEVGLLSNVDGMIPRGKLSHGPHHIQDRRQQALHYEN